MKKFYLIIFSLFISWGMIAQIITQGVPRNDLNSTQVKSLQSTKNLKPTTDASFTFDDIKYWIGEGSNKAAFVVQWNDEKNPDALVWGYRWEGIAYGLDMIKAIAKNDPRLYALLYEGTPYGTAIGGFGFDLDLKNTIALILNGDTTYPKYPTDGIVSTSSYNFDDWTSYDSNDHWQSGWSSKGYWSYYVKEEGESFSYLGMGASSRKLKNGSWDAWTFMPDFSGGDLSSTFTAVNLYTPLAVDYTQGIFFVNEDWFGHTNGSVNFLTNKGDFIYRAYSRENNNEAFGAITQYGTMYGDNFYFISKQAKDGGDTFYTPGGRLVVADAKTLQKKAGFDNIGGGDGRSFLGVDENTGYIGTSNGIFIFDSKNLKVGNLIPGTGGGSAYSGQIGNMIRTSQYVFAVKQSTGLLVIDPSTHNLVTTISGTSFNTITQSKDGNLWIGAGSKLIKLNPLTFETEEIPLTSTTISSSWGAWNAGSFCASIQSNVLYWTNSGTWGGGSTISKYDIDTEILTPLFYEIPEQKDENGVALQYKQIFYGAGLRIDPITDNLIITATQSGYGAHYQKNWVHKVDNKGNLVQTYPLDDYYWFPALPVFPDNYAPKISETLPAELSINSETIIDLKDKVTDADNLNSAIVKTLKEIDNNGVITALINKEDQLVLTPLKKGTASIEIKFNSNGKIVSRELAVKVASTLGTDDISATHSLALYPNPCKEYFFIEVQQTDLLSIYSLTGSKVYEQKLEKGKNKIHVSALKSGIYFVKTKNNTYKIIIQ